ncbi:MAG: DMT family transporter [Proteobacteria bacterium]|nr:DMT family transporter [Pseudomonadota bacterium]
MSDQARAYLYGLVTVLFWSTVASAFKLSLRYLDTIQLLLYANLVSLLCLGLILFLQGKLKGLFSFTAKQYLQSAGLGLLNPFLYYLILFKAYDLLPAQEAQPLNYTWALTLMFLSIPLLRQRIGPKDILAGIIGYSGVLIISTHGDPLSLRFSNTQGVALALLSTVIWALYWIANKKSEIDPISALFLNFLFSLPFILVVCLLFSDFEVAHPYGLLGAAYVGVFEMGITFVCWLMALKLSLNTAKVGNLIFISPFLSLVFIHFLVGEEILPSTFVGLVVITASLLIQQIKPR